MVVLWAAAAMGAGPWEAAAEVGTKAKYVAATVAALEDTQEGEKEVLRVAMWEGAAEVLLAAALAAAEPLEASQEGAAAAHQARSLCALRK